MLLNVFFSAVATFTTAISAASFTNPLKQTNGSDPFIVYDGGYYYLTTTTWSDIQVTRATTINGLKTGTPKVVWKDSNANRCCNVWAPEIHKIDNSWYIYYTAGQTSDLGFQRPFVLKGKCTNKVIGGATPWDTYAYLGQLSTEWGIDGTITTINSKLYFIWSCQADSLQSLCIASLISPTTIGQRYVISEPTNSWEKEEGELAVNEGPAVIQQDGKVFVAFSASFCWTDKYQLGLLTLGAGKDPLLIGSWTKTGPVFSSANGNYGPGHNGFFTSPDNTQWWNVYHATANSNGACDGNRYTAVQIVNWNSNGSPNLGAPLKVGTTLTGPSGEK